MAPGSELGESNEPIGGLVKVRPDMKSGLSFLWRRSHRGHCGQSVPRFLDCAPFNELPGRNTWEKVIAGPAAARSITARSASRARRIPRPTRPRSAAPLPRQLRLARLPRPRGRPRRPPRPADRRTATGPLQDVAAQVLTLRPPGEA